MQKRGWRLLLVLAVIAAVVILAVIFWPRLSPWLPHPRLVSAWFDYLIVDLNIGRWGPVATLLLVGVIELVWALNLGRRSGSYERQWDRLERLHARELEVLNQEVSLLKEERRALRAELELREDLIREEKVRLWASFEDLQRKSGLFRRWVGGDGGDMGAGVLQSQSVLFQGPDMSSEIRGQWRETISQLERIEMITSVTVRRTQSALQVQQRADELMRLGMACYYLGQYERALVHYNKAVELIPNDPKALISRAVVHHDLSRHQPALQDLDRALKLGENPWAYLYRGLIREGQGEEKRALEDYTRAIRLNSEFLEGYYHRGLLLSKLEEYDKAFQDQNRVLELDSEHAGAHTARGVARAALGDSQWALNDLDQGCALAPQSAQAFFDRGCVRQSLGMQDEALADFQYIIELEPDFAPAYMARGDAYAALEEHWQAINDYNRTIELQPKNAAAYYARGLARAATREYRRAIEDYERALELDPGFAVALANRGAAYEKVGEYSQAIRDLDQAITLDPDLAIAYYNRGLAYGSIGEYDKASRDLNRAVELDPSLGNDRQGLLGGKAG
ncbi:MAG: tetratricopeptide repeat protein [Anaerolineae bacterium]|jgi:tetratricopeptide (TPR) repeat protein